MGYKDITAGKKIAKLMGARFIRTDDKPDKKGSVGVELGFEFKEPTTGEQETIRGILWITPLAAERSMKVLVEVLGFNGNDRPMTNGFLNMTESFSHQNEVEIDVQPEEYNGTTSMRVKWINQLGGGGFSNCEPEVLKKELGAVNFKGLFLAAKKNFDQGGGAQSEKKVAPAPKAAPKKKAVGDDEVPF